MSNSEFFDYEKNLCNLIDNQSKIDIYKSPNKQKYRKRSEDDDLLHFDFDKGRFTFMKKNINENKKTDTLLSDGRRKRIYSQKFKRNKLGLIIRDIEPKDETSESHSIYFKNYIHRTPISKSVKNLNRYRKKKVTFKNKFVSIIDVENYKKYNVNDDLYNRNADAKCTCIIY